MSVFIRGGYFAFSKKLLNITLKPTTAWHHGLLLTNKNQVITTLNPQKENKLELKHYPGTTVLVLNEEIIYEHKKLFTYYLDLALTEDDFIWNKDKVASCIKYEYISCK